MAFQVRFSRNEPVFFKTLRDRVDNYFQSNAKQTTGDYRLYLKSGILTATLIALYILLVFVNIPTAWIWVPLAMIMGFNVSAIGFNVMHDGAHGSYSKYKWLNESSGFSLNILGGNVQLWKLKHNINHHTFTNVEGLDDDIDIKPFIRTNANQKKYWFHRWQHIYGVGLYGLTYIFWVFWQDFKKYFTRKIAEGTPLQKFSKWDHINFWTSKVLHLFIFIVIPVYMKGPWALLGYAIMAISAGVVLAIVFQLAHLVEHSHFVGPVENEINIESEWAVHQLQTTVNFATRNKVISWFLGGLNYQVEHHLFPRISHVHYPQINRIIKETCKEFNVAYHEFPTMFRAFRSHLSYLKAVGA